MDTKSLNHKITNISVNCIEFNKCTPKFALINNTTSGMSSIKQQ